MTVEEVLERNVENGVAYLEEHEENWRGRIDPDTLNVGFGNRCVCGQLNGEGYTSYTNEHGLSLEQSIGLGFQYDPNLLGEMKSSEQYQYLTELWKQKLVEKVEDPVAA